MPIITKNIQKHVDQVVGFVCNNCQITHREDVDYTEIVEMVHINFVGGYGSVWGDGNTVDITLCQHCCHKLLGSIAEVTDDVR